MHSPQPTHPKLIQRHPRRSNYSRLSARNVPVWGGLLISAVLLGIAPTAVFAQAQSEAVSSVNNSSSDYFSTNSSTDSLTNPSMASYTAQAMTDSVSESAPHSTMGSDPSMHAEPVSDADFQRIDQSWTVKALVTAGGLVLMAVELWWFLGHRTKSNAVQADETQSG